MAMVGVVSGYFTAISGLVLGRRPLGAILRSSNEPGELSQWLCHDDSTINIVVLIIIIIICIADCSLEMLDKVEPPAVADGYGLSVALVCMLDIVKSIQSLVQPVADSTTSSSSTADVPLRRPVVESVSTPDAGIACCHC